MNRWPDLNAWIYSAKTFAAAMLSLYIAMYIGLDRPYWAMATVYIVSQPLIGALRSKAVFRLIGTTIGAAATIVLVPNLVGAPELLSAALALWTGLCLYLALLDRTPRSYVFMLAGYTAALIGFPAVTTPSVIWDIALARVEEIWLGIICSTVVGTLILPRPLGPLLSARILAWLTNASDWTQEVLHGGEDPAHKADHLKLAADVVELRLLTSQLAWDTSIMQSATRWVGELQRRMVLLLPLLSSIDDRLTALRAANGMTQNLERLLADLCVWVRAGTRPPRSEADQLRQRINRCERETDPRAGWNEVMRDSVLLRLRQLVDVRQDLRDLRQHIETGGGRLPTPLAVQLPGPEVLHHDHGLALLSGFAATVAVSILCVFWIATGWSSGGAAASLAAAACSLFAAMDDPTPALKQFLFSAILSIIFVGVGLFGILPQVHDFEMLALVLSAFFVPVGVLTAMPATQALGTVLGFLTATLLSLQSAYAANFVSYADGSFAALLGVACAAATTAIIRSVGAEWSARRLLRAGWRDLAAIAHSKTPQDVNTLMVLLLDRIGLLVPRLASVGRGNDLAAVDALTDLRIGVNMVDLRRDRDALSPPVRAAVDSVLFGTADQFATRAATGRVQRASPGLLTDIDRALDAAVAISGPGGRDLLLQLGGIRRGLFPNAAPYRPTPPPDHGETRKPLSGSAT